MRTTTPFGAPVQEVPLSRAPLVNVIAQVRFPAVMKIEADSGFVATFQELIRKDYPILRPERQLGVMVGPGGVQSQDAGTIWRFEMKDPDAWQVTLSPTFVSLSTKRYTRRSDLIARLTVVLHALEGWLHPDVCDRVGIRYVDRVTGDQLARLSKLVRSEILGVAGDESMLGSIEVVMRYRTRSSSWMTCRSSAGVGAGFPLEPPMTLGSNRHENPPGYSTWTTTPLNQRTSITPQSAARLPSSAIASTHSFGGP